MAIPEAEDQPGSSSTSWLHKFRSTWSPSATGAAFCRINPKIASAVHLHFQKWQQAGFFLRLWRAGLAEYDEMEAIAWNWQSIDGAMHKEPLAAECVGPNPTDREKNGRKRSLLVDGMGVPLWIVAGGANTHDVKLLEATLDQLVMEMPVRAVGLGAAVAGPPGGALGAIVGNALDAPAAELVKTCAEHFGNGPVKDSSTRERNLSSISSSPQYTTWNPSIARLSDLASPDSCCGSRSS